MHSNNKFDVVIIGSGAAGLTLALSLEKKLKVAIISKSKLFEGSTYYAQGGIAAVLDASDSIDAHCEDTLIAGGGLCHEDSVRFTIKNSREAIEWLISQGVEFTRENTEGYKLDEKSNDYHLAREGGHSSRRIIHAADATGKAVSETLINKVNSSKNIIKFENHVAVDIIVERDQPTPTCCGVYILNCNKKTVETFQSKFVILATGGASKAYLYTSNPDGASGDGIAMAWRAGCRIANMEFNQFHPTCLYHPQAKSFLISEAVRGEGGKLILENGKPFMHRFDQRAELAPRDIVARAIDHEMKRLGSDCVYLDVSHLENDFIKSHFPNIYNRCMELGINITEKPIPVVPAAHYTCGGVIVDKHGGTDIKNLYAIGETSFTGLHGANRMASNSLLECIVYAQSAAKSILEKVETTQWQTPPKLWDESKVKDSDEDIIIAHNWDELRRFMWNYVGIVRTTKRLERAKHRIQMLRDEINEYYGNYRVSGDLIELRNLALVSELIIDSALRRKESRGLHYTLDYPGKKQHAQDTILYPPNFIEK
jgi:L-aspartate oxidase